MHSCNLSQIALPVVISSTNSVIKYDLLHITIFFVNKDLIDYSKQASLHKIQRMIMIDSNNSL